MWSSQNQSFEDPHNQSFECKPAYGYRIDLSLLTINPLNASQFYATNSCFADRARTTLGQPLVNAHHVEGMTALHCTQRIPMLKVHEANGTLPCRVTRLVPRGLCHCLQHNLVHWRHAEASRVGIIKGSPNGVLEIGVCCPSPVGSACVVIGKASSSSWPVDRHRSAAGAKALGIESPRNIPADSFQGTPGTLEIEVAMPSRRRQLQKLS